MIPLTIWMFWEDGFENAPPLVKLCLEQWRVRCPALNFQLLEQDAIETFLPDYKDRDITIQAKSDILRMRLLSTYGGIWADAATLPRVDVGLWIENLNSEDFLAFSYENSEFLLSSWFIAAPKGSYILSKWAERTDEYWNSDRKLEVGPRQPKRFKNRLLRQGNFLDIAHVNAHPYFWLHYLFDDLIQKDQIAAQIWGDTASPSSEVAHRLQSTLRKFGSTRPRKLRRAWAASPVHKLDWRLDIDEQFVKILGL